MFRTNTYLESTLEVHQTIRTYVTRKNINPGKRKFFEKCVSLFFENGFSNKLYQFTPPNYSGIEFVKRGGRGQDGFMHYDGLQAYIAENTIVEALHFDKLDYLFRVYVALLIAFLFLNFAHYYVKSIGLSQIRHLFLRIKQKLAIFARKLYTFFYP